MKFLFTLDFSQIKYSFTLNFSQKQLYYHIPLATCLKFSITYRKRYEREPISKAPGMEGKTRQTPTHFKGGGRQVGKSYLLTQFGKNEFSNFVCLNFEKNPKYKEFFNTREPNGVAEV